MEATVPQSALAPGADLISDSALPSTADLVVGKGPVQFLEPLSLTVYLTVMMLSLF